MNKSNLSFFRKQMVNSISFSTYFFFFLLFSFNVIADENSCTLEVPIVGTIGPSSLDFIERAEDRAIKKKCKSILVTINTPGGSLQTTRLIVEKILNSPLPFLCLVSPAGGHAGSAGAIILQSCHVAGALETTNIGAATPIASTGQEMPEDLRNKLVNDTTSWLDGLTKLRGRSQNFGRDIIEKAKAVSADEAFKIGAIDFVGKSKEDFLTFAQDRKVAMPQDRTEQVSVGNIIPMSLDIRYQLLSFFTDPQTAYVMFMGSLGLLYFEITHPGMILPGVVGGIGLVLSLVSLHKLDVFWGAVILILLGIVLMISESFVAGFGILGLGGVVSFLFGSLFLFDPETTGIQLPLSLIIPTTLIMGVITMGIAYLAFKTRNVKPHSGSEEIIGRTAKVIKIDSINLKEGLVEFDGESWNFKSQVSLEVGDLVKVLEINGLTLKVEKIKEQLI